MPTPATYDDANLVLRLYELRREEKMRKAREWFGSHFSASTLEELLQIAPMGSQENAYFRMITSYWDMAATFVTSGVLNQELFFQTNGELLFVWERIRDLVPLMRAQRKNQRLYHNMETVANAHINWMSSHSPEAHAQFQEMVRGVVAKR